MSRVSKAVKLALADNALGSAVLKSCSLSSAKRKNIVAEIDDYEELRSKVRKIRENSIVNLDLLLDQFSKEFTSAGGKLHTASDAKEAVDIVLSLLKSRNFTSGIKSKSMVSEEIELGKALKRNGIDAVESDLGEFIVQLAGEPPSHITAPALHRSRQSIGKLLSQELKFPYTDNPEKLTREVRSHLRKRFLTAEFGIAGANFVVARSGHIVLVENEGNGRMGFTMPPLFIAITGIEKVIESLADLGPLLRVLARNATGQRFSTYTSLIRPTAPGEEGPKEFHLILLDNGRRSALADPELCEMLLCIRCGACLNTCPVYKTVGGHAYKSVYPGPMGAVWSNIVGEPDASSEELANLSTLCGACKEVCPVDIDIPRMLLELRARKSKGVIETKAAQVFRWTSEKENRFYFAGKALRQIGVILPNGLPGGWLAGGEPAFREIVEENDSDSDEE